MKLQGIFVDMATPFDHEGRLYRSKVRFNVSKYCRTTIAGILVGGAAGEGPLLSFEEKRDLFKMVKESVEDERILLAGVDCAGVEESVDLARSAAEAGFHVVVAYPPRIDGRLDSCPEIRSLFFRSLADRSPLPVAAFGENIEHPNVAAVIEQDPLRIKEIANTGRRVLCSSEPALFESLKNGASGGILPLASAAPYAAIAVWEAFRTREEEAGLDWQERIRVPSQLVNERFGVAALKAAMDRNGYFGGKPRLPLRPLTAAEEDEVDAAFRYLRG
jgi:4-hydroxy-2-oxoglutarate aldolase